MNMKVYAVITQNNLIKKKELKADKLHNGKKLA